MCECVCCVYIYIYITFNIFSNYVLVSSFMISQNHCISCCFCISSPLPSFFKSQNSFSKSFMYIRIAILGSP